MAAPSYNGRIDISTGPNAKEFPRTSSSTQGSGSGSGSGSSADEALRGIQQAGKLSEVFFSRENIEALQQGIRYLVYEKSCKKHIIDRQSEDDLRVVMRSIYLQNAVNLPYMILEQVRALNQKVLEFVVPRVLEEIKMYIDYKQRVSTLPVPMARSENTSVAGTKTLELRDF